MKLKIVTPEKLVFDQEADSITLPGSEGQMTILPGHAALAATLKAGEFYFRMGGEIPFKKGIGPGFVEVTPAQVTVMVKSFG